MPCPKDLQELVSKLVVDDDDDGDDDHLLIELSGDMLEEISGDIRYAATAAYPGFVIFLVEVFDGVLNVDLEEGVLTFLSPTLI